MNKMNAIAFLIVIILAIVTRILTSPVRKGKKGEARVKKQLKQLDETKFRILNNLMIGHKDKIVQIDHLVVSIYGIFVIETKNYSGWIYGNERSENWTQVLFQVKKRFRNPIKQNWAHVITLKEIGASPNSV